MTKSTRRGARLPNVIALAVISIAGCSREEPPSAPVAAAPMPTSLAHDERFRDFMRRVLGPSPTLEQSCRAGAPEAVRITRYHGLPQPLFPGEPGSNSPPIGPAGYTVLVVADGESAIAHWHGIGELLSGYGFRTYGAQAVRLDGNGWRQVQQQLRQPDFLRIEPFSQEVGRFAPHTEPSPWWIEHCRDGHYRLLMRLGAPDDEGSHHFHRVAQHILRLGGNVYPGDRSDPRRL